MRIRPRAVALFLTLLVSIDNSPAAERWFEELKATATPVQLYTFLYALPKGGDLHNHLGGAARSEWLWDAALAQQAQEANTDVLEVRRRAAAEVAGTAVSQIV